MHKNIIFLSLFGTYWNIFCTFALAFCKECKKTYCSIVLSNCDLGKN